MTTFDELIGAEPEGAEREQLRRVHELLLEAGPPPELTPELESGPTLQMTLGRVRSIATSSSRRRLYIPAIAAAILVVMVLGLSLQGGKTGVTAVPLRGTVAAPNATGTIAVLEATKDGQPMTIQVEGLQPGVYAVYLTRSGGPWEKCGTFTVTSSTVSHPATITSPYRAEKGDTWVVTRPANGGRGVTVMRPVRT